MSFPSLWYEILTDIRSWRFLAWLSKNLSEIIKNSAHVSCLHIIAQWKRVDLSTLIRPITSIIIIKSVPIKILNTCWVSAHVYNSVHGASAHKNGGWGNRIDHRKMPDWRIAKYDISYESTCSSLCIAIQYKMISLWTAEIWAPTYINIGQTPG